MKKIMILVAGLMLGTVLTYAQDIAESQVPSVVVNNFRKEFPKASDAEWEQKGNQFEVDYEIGLVDHEAWFDNTGKMVKHTEEIKVQDLPETVRNVIKKDYNGYRTSDVKKITEETQTSYKVELEQGNLEWKIIFNEAGKELSKVND